MKYIKAICFALMAMLFFYNTHAQNSKVITIGKKNVHRQQVDFYCDENNFSQQLNQALSAISEGGVIQILDGKYSLNEEIKLKAKQSIIGMGNHTVLLVNRNHSVFTLHSNNNKKLVSSSVSNLQILIKQASYDASIIRIQTDQNATHQVSNNAFKDIKIVYEREVGELKLIDLMAGSKSFIRDNDFTNVELIYPEAKRANIIHLMANGKIRDNDFQNIKILRKEGFTNSMIYGQGIYLQTGNLKAFILNNHFSNIVIPPIENGIKIALGSPSKSAVNESWINNNRFVDINIDGYKNGIVFYKAPGLNQYDFARNLFQDIILQSKSYSEIAIENVFGKGNSFVHCNVYDWGKKNKNLGKWIYEISKDASFTYISNPRIFQKYILDRGQDTYWNTNGSVSGSVVSSKINKTGELQLYDTTSEPSPINAPKAGAKIHCVEDENAHAIKFYTREDGNFSKQLEVQKNGDLWLAKRLHVSDLPHHSKGQVLVNQNNTIGTIETKELKEDLGIGSILKRLKNLEQEKENHKWMEQELVRVNTELDLLKKQLNL